MRFFRNGGTLYGLIYILWRGGHTLLGILFTKFYQQVLKECASNSKFGRSVYISHPKSVEIGSSCFIGSGVNLFAEETDGWIFIGNNVQISPDCRIDFTGGLLIKDDVLISDDVWIYSHDHGYDSRSAPQAHTITIESNAWLGARSLILPSAKRIGENAIVGAGAVVTKPVPDGAIVAGNPAKIIKIREDLVANTL